MKYLVFWLNEIREITLGSRDWHILQEYLSIQNNLVQERIGELQFVLNAIDNTPETIEKYQYINWNHMMDLIQSSRKKNTDLCITVRKIDGKKHNGVNHYQPQQ